MRSSMDRWIKGLRELESPLAHAQNTARGAKMSPPIDVGGVIESSRLAIQAIASEIVLARERLSAAKEVMEVRKAEAEYKCSIVEAWPNDQVAERVSYLGAGIFAAGGAAYALTGYPTHSLSLVPPILFWACGFGLLVFGIWRVNKNQRDKETFFKSQFEPEIKGTA